MELLWSLAVATGGKYSSPKNVGNKQTVATGCDQLPIGAGKEGVDGSSPSEGFPFSPAQPPFPLPALAGDGISDVHPASTAWTSTRFAFVNASINSIACSRPSLARCP